jgi:hypothetical protein
MFSGSAIKAALANAPGYQILSDTWQTGQRLAVCTQGVQFEEVLAGRLFRFTVQFDCKPQIWRDRQDKAVAAAGIVILIKPTDALWLGSSPYIEVFGAGTVTLSVGQFGTQSLGTLTASGTSPALVIDCEAKIAYKSNGDGTRANVPLAWWPEPGGSTTATFSGGIFSQINWYTRWWRL